ncbi:hypothetical protein ACFE04_031847 [Oxalis oulophora]
MATISTKGQRRDAFTRRDQTLDFLKLRQTLKDNIRKKIFNKGTDCSSKQNSNRNDNNGSFFGPSETIILSSSVIHNRALVLAKHQSRKAISSSLWKKTPEASNNSIMQEIRKIQDSKSKTSSSIWSEKIPRVLKPNKKELKEARDYSSLFADEPEPVIVPTQRVEVKKVVKEIPKKQQPPVVVASKKHMEQSAVVRKVVERQVSSKDTNLAMQQQKVEVQHPKKKPRIQKNEDEKSTTSTTLKKKQPRRASDNHSNDPNEDLKALMMIRKMFNTERYANADDDDRNMVVGFNEILKEEKRSARIGRKEDAKELELIIEEEKRERERKISKKSSLVC